MNPSESRLNSGITPRNRLPLGPGGTSPDALAFFLGKFSILSMFLDDARASFFRTSEQISVDPWFTPRNDDGSYRFLIKLHGSHAPYDAVNITQLLQTLHARK